MWYQGPMNYMMFCYQTTTRSANEVQARRSRGDLSGNQGIYFYRLDRLIQHGGWSRAFSPEPLFIGKNWNRRRPKLGWWNSTQCNKTKIERPDELKQDLNAIFSDLRVHAEEVYRLHNGQTRIWPETEIDPKSQPHHRRHLLHLHHLLHLSLSLKIRQTYCLLFLRLSWYVIWKRYVLRMRKFICWGEKTIQRTIDSYGENWCHFLGTTWTELRALQLQMWIF